MYFFYYVVRVYIYIYTSTRRSYEIIYDSIITRFALMNDPRYALNLTNSKHNVYFIGLIDTKKSEFDGMNKTYNTVLSRVDSAVQEYFPLLCVNLNKRGNWLQMNYKQAFDYHEIDFCMCNFAKLQTKSRVHYRILLDVDKHFISNKGEFYKTFHGNDFIPENYQAIYKDHRLHYVNNLMPTFDADDYVIVKPDKGYLGLDIQIIKFKEIGTLKLNSFYEDWTVSKIYRSKLYNDGVKNVIVTNRIYFAVVKINNTVSGYIFDEFVNYCAIQNFKNDGSDFEKANFAMRLLSNFSPENYSENLFMNNRYVSHKKYVSMFTKSEFQTIFQKIAGALKIVTEEIAKHISCSNDRSNYTSTDNYCAFHLYGVDSILDDLNNVKIIEINGAPSINDRIRYFPRTQCMDYNILVNELLKISVDKIIRPTFAVDYGGYDNYGFYKDSLEKEILFRKQFIKIHESTAPCAKHMFYISKQVALKYPFILNGFFSNHRSFFYKRIKNPHRKDIDVFYGLRDLYTNKFTSEKYYNELVEYNNCVCSRNAKILNKIQGVTYYLANKERLYNRLIQCYAKDIVSYHPPSTVVKVTNKSSKMCSKESCENIQRISSFMESTNFNSLIIKPTNGSQGKGIHVVTGSDMNVYFMLNLMNEVRNTFHYDTFLISKYIDNPKLYKKPGDTVGRKFNIRFYVLLLLDSGDSNNYLHAFLLNKQLIYYSILEYNWQQTHSRLPVGFHNVTEDDLLKMQSLTNLQIIANMNLRYKLGLQVDDYLDLLNDLSIEDSLQANIAQQFQSICTQTIHATQNEFRAMNRGIEDHVAFNLVAYDTLLDNNNLLHLIEVNRGADLVGLQRTIGEAVVTRIFAELFDICVDGKRDQFEHFFPV